MLRAVWNDTVLADAPANAVEVVEGNVYFPPQFGGGLPGGSIRGHHSAKSAAAD